MAPYYRPDDAAAGLRAATSKGLRARAGAAAGQPAADGGGHGADGADADDDDAAGGGLGCHVRGRRGRQFAVCRHAQWRRGHERPPEPGDDGPGAVAGSDGDADAEWAGGDGDDVYKFNTVNN